MENDEVVKSDETRTFLQEGFHSYAPALVAVSEFRRLISLKLQGVLEESATRLSDLGLGIDGGLKLKRPSLDDVNLSVSYGSIELEKSQNARFYTNYHVIWHTDGPKEKQVRVGVFVWTDKKEKRNSLFKALQKEQKVLKKVHLSQDPNGLSRLALYCNPELFPKIDEPFRALVEEWIELLASIGGIQPFLPEDVA
jgi:hypothetical protein